MEEREDIKETGNRFADGLLMPIFAVGAVFLFIILCFYAYNNVMKNKNNGDQVIILEGDDGGFKVAPVDPGGMEVEHKDKEVFNTVTGQAEDLAAGDVNVEKTEAPVTHDELAAGTEGQVSAVSYDPASDTSTVIINPSEQAEGSPAEIPAVPEEAAVPVAAPAAEDAVKIQDPFANNEVTESSAPVSAPKEEKKAEQPEKEVAPVVMNSESPSVEEVRKEVETSVKTEVSKETDKATGESTTVIKFKDKPKSMGGATVSPAAAAGSYYVQISSHSTRSEANSAWVKFVKTHSSDVGGKSNNVTEASVSGKTFYRLSFGPFSDRSDASTKCGILKAKGQDCIIQKY